MRIIPVLAACSAAFATAATPAAAQRAAATTTGRSDPRWYPWIGCWSAEPSSGATSASSDLTCVVPAASGAGVDVVTVAHGAVTARARLDASGHARALDTDGCRGTAVGAWSASERRVYETSTYTCDGGISGRASEIDAFATNGDWLRVREVRSGDGANVSVERLRDAGIPAHAPSGVTRAIERVRLAAATARAAASAPITIDELVNAVQATDSNAVRSWVIASDQHFVIDATQAQRLSSGELPQPVLQAMLGTSARDRDGRYASPSRAADAYLNTPVYVNPGYQPAEVNIPVYRSEPAPAAAPPPYEPQVYPYGYVYPYSFGYPIIVRGHDGDHRGEGRGDGHGGDGHAPAPRPGPSGRRP